MVTDLFIVNDLFFGYAVVRAVRLRLTEDGHYYSFRGYASERGEA